MKKGRGSLVKPLKQILLFLFVLVIIPAACITHAFAKAKPLSCIKTVKKDVVCLTVDDGWSKTTVNKVLKVLRKNKVTCTFFIVGSRLKAMPEVWKKAIKDGHEICYHTMYHQNLRRKSNKKIIADIKKWEKTARKVLGKDYKIPKLARLPGGSGSRDQRILTVFAKRGYKVIYWSLDTLAHRRHVVSYIKKRTKPGAIILTHFNGYDSKALPKYIRWLKKRFKLVKLSEALAPPKPEPKPA